MESCGMSCIKYLLVAFNGIFMIFGIVIIAVASSDLVMLQPYGDDVAPKDTDIVLIVIGVAIVVIAAFGCFGAWKESTKLLYIFAGTLIVIILLELSVAIAAAALRPQLEEGIKTRLRSSFIKNKSTNDDNESVRRFWDNIQDNLKCCGVSGPHDYTTAGVNPSFSCCEKAYYEKDAEQKNRERSECLRDRTFYQEGCEKKVLSGIRGAGIGVIVTVILFCFLEVGGIVLALWMAHAIKTQGKRNETA